MHNGVKVSKVSNVYKAIFYGILNFPDYFLSYNEYWSFLPIPYRLGTCLYNSIFHFDKPKL